MGEIADMMIEGAMCQGCVEYIVDDTGYPRWCSSCEPDDTEDWNPKPRKVECPACGKHVSEQGLCQHVAAKHSSL